MRQKHYGVLYGSQCRSDMALDMLHSCRKVLRGVYTYELKAHGSHDPLDYIYLPHAASLTDRFQTDTEISV